MRDFKRITALPVLVLLPYLATGHGIHPYIDAGSASMIISALVGGLMTVVVAIRVFWTQIKAFFGKLFHAKRRKDDE